MSRSSRPLTLRQLEPNGKVEVVLPEHGVYSGAYIDFGEAEDAVALETIEDFEQMVGKHQAIIASSSYWGEQNFPTANLAAWSGVTARFRWFSGRRGTGPTSRKKDPTDSRLNSILAGDLESLHR